MTKRSKILPIILYSLPVLFFIISFFLLTASGEDIWQGANHLRMNIPLNPAQDAIDAFRLSSRITDMYAWAVIDFFDYQFSFGPDIVFRLIDVIAASATFYLATYLILGYKPRLKIRDSLVFCLTFLVFIITPFGRPFYHEFSMIHNYVSLALITLLFSIPYLNLIRKKPPTKNLALFALGMLLLGIIFGMSATITPLAFLITAIIYLIIKRKSIPSLSAWFFTGIAGTLIGFTICWLAGSGVEHYTNPTTAAVFDYVSIGDIFHSPITSIIKLLWHEVHNFGITTLPLVVTAVTYMLLSCNPRQFLNKTFYSSLPSTSKQYILIFGTYIVIHILGATLVKAPPRLLIPAYLAGIILTGNIFTPYINIKTTGIALVTLTVIVIIVHTTFLIIYHNTASTILTEINQCNCTDICIDRPRVAPPRIPIIDLSQANILVDWGAPEIIYNKRVTFCK